jgi:hypothetical protein
MFPNTSRPLGFSPRGQCGLSFASRLIPVSGVPVKGLLETQRPERLLGADFGWASLRSPSCIRSATAAAPADVRTFRSFGAPRNLPCADGRMIRAVQEGADRFCCKRARTSTCSGKVVDRLADPEDVGANRPALSDASRTFARSGAQAGIRRKATVDPNCLALTDLGQVALLRFDRDPIMVRREGRYWPPQRRVS